MWDYVGLEGKARPAAAELLAESFEASSRLWRAYVKRLLESVGTKGWDVPEVARELKRALRTETCYELLLDVVPNSPVLRESYSPDLALYYGVSGLHYNSPRFLRILRLFAAIP